MGNKGFINKAKSGTVAASARGRQAASAARLADGRKPRSVKSNEKQWVELDSERQRMPAEATAHRGPDD